MHNDPVNCVDLWGLADIVIFSAIDLTDSTNNKLYDFFVHDSYNKIKKAAEDAGKTVADVICGNEATLANLQDILDKENPERLIIVAHGDENGDLYDVNDKIISLSKANPNLEIVDLVGCYASSNTQFWGTNTTVRTYNTGSSTPDNTDDDEQIWFYQTNEALDKKIPESIKNNNSNTSGDPKKNRILDSIINFLGFGNGVKKETGTTNEKKNK